VTTPSILKILSISIYEPTMLSIRWTKYDTCKNGIRCVAHHPKGLAISISHTHNCWKIYNSFLNGYVLKEIQVSKVSASILKSISFETNNYLWSSSIKHIFNVFPKISRILELLRASCKSFCVHVPIWNDFKEVARSLILCM
jgi:hypothetical protein